MPKALDGRPTCTARSKQSGERCKQYPKRGFTVCKWHGGGTKAAAQKAAERRASQDAAAAWAKVSADLPAVDDPLTELSKLASQVVAWKDMLAQLVDDLQANYRYETEYNEALRGEVLLFERAMDRCASVLGLIAKLNIDDRLAAIEESQARMLEEGLLAAFEEAGLGITDADAKERVTRAFTRHLAVVPA
jgi:hypothetical protein